MFANSCLGHACSWQRLSANLGVSTNCRDFKDANALRFQLHVKLWAKRATRPDKLVKHVNVKKVKASQMRGNDRQAPRGTCQCLFVQAFQYDLLYKCGWCSNLTNDISVHQQVWGMGGGGQRSRGVHSNRFSFSSFPTFPLA